MNTQNINNQVEIEEIVSLEAALAEFALDDAIEDECTDSPDAVLSDEDMDEIEANENAVVNDDMPIEIEELESLDKALAQEALYENQTSSLTVAPISTTFKQEAQSATAIAPILTPSQPNKTASKAKTGRTPRVANLDAVSDRYFILTGDEASMSEAELEANKKMVIASKPKQVKVAEKFDNIFTSIANSTAPYRYTQVAFVFVQSKQEVNSADIVKMFMDTGLSEGTARSQTGQIMALFANTKIADRNGQKLKIRSDSVVAKRLQAIIAPAS